MSTLAVGTIKSVSSAAPVIQNSSGTEKGQFIAAWMNYDGTNNTLRDDFNVSSVSDNATGNFTVSFSNGFANSNYCVTSIGSRSSTSEFLRFPSYTNGDTYSTTAFQMRCVKDSDTGSFDRPYNFLMFIGA